jgi:hypothetical protein
MAKVVKIGDMIENCLNDVPLHPATTAPEKSTQSFQTGDVVNMNHKYTFENSQITVAGGAEKSAAYRAIVGKKQMVELGDGFAGYGVVYVSTGPTLVANGEAVPTLTITIEWLTTIDPETGELVHPTDSETGE